MRRRQFHQSVFAAAAGFFARTAMSFAEDTAEDENVNLVTPTLGGMQFWADELFYNDWHIQRNCFTGHCRLLDGKGLRHAWGSFESCEQRLNEIRSERKLPSMSGKAVIALHGLTRSANSMSKLSRHLREQDGYTVFNVNYPSTRGTVGDHAKSLAKIVGRLDGIEEINFVAHSLGNLVIRHYIGDTVRAPEGGADPRWHRMVMLGAPNNGAIMAETLLNNPVGHALIGASGDQLAHDWPELLAHLATPPFEFGIVAGGCGNNRGYNPLLGGDNDLLVTVDSAKLPGASDLITLPVMHAFMMEDKRVLEHTLRYLQHGYFVDAEHRQPIAVPESATPDLAKPQANGGGQSG